MYYSAMMIVERMDADIARGVTESYRGQSILGLRSLSPSTHSDWGVTESSDTAFFTTAR